MKRKTAALLCAAWFTITGCASSSPDDPAPDATAQELVDQTWNNSSQEERAAVCADIDSMGIDGFARAMSETWEEADAKVVTRLLADKCAEGNVPRET